MFKHILLGCVFWLLLAVGPTLTILFWMISFYSPLKGIGHEYFYARGRLLERQDGIGRMTFDESSTFWDTSDVAPLGSTLKLLTIHNPDAYQPGVRVIIRGTRVGFLGDIDNITIYKNHFQPWGVDWAKAIILLFFILTVTSMFLSTRFLNEKSLAFIFLLGSVITIVMLALAVLFAPSCNIYDPLPHMRQVRCQCLGVTYELFRSSGRRYDQCFGVITQETYIDN